jgi:hypothetical protein
MADRLATLTDQANFATDTNGELKAGDYIIDTPFSTSSGRGQIFITNLATKMAGIRFGGKIWFDMGVLPPLFALETHNNNVIWNGVSDADNPITFRPLRGPVEIIMNSSSNTARMWLMADIPNLSVNGVTDNHPGMKYPWSGGMSGKFGFYISGGTTLSEEPFQMMISGPSGMKSISLRGIEIEHGYCSLRILPGNGNVTLDKFEARQLYLHDSINGEGFYVGQTVGSPFAKFKEVRIKDIVCAQTATEAIQLQHLLMSAEKGICENFIAYAAAYKWKAAFQEFQGGCNQWLVDEGDNMMQNFIIDGWADSGFSLLGSSIGTPNNAPAIIRNGLINDGRRLGVYMNTTMNHGVKWELRDLYFRQFNNTYNEIDNQTVFPYAISAKNGTDKVSLINLTWDNSKTSLLESESGYESYGHVQDNAMPAPEYKNNGFPGKKAEQIEQWAELYAYWTDRAGEPISYNSGDIVALWRENVMYRYFICLGTHSSTPSTRPDIDPAHWTVITWDESGVPSYYPGHNPSDTQTYQIQQDFRLVADSEWNLKGMGLSMNERNTNTSSFQWYIANVITGTGAKELAGETRRILHKNPEDVGRYVRLKMYFKKADDSFEEVWVTGWTLLT